MFTRKSYSRCLSCLTLIAFINVMFWALMANAQRVEHKTTLTPAKRNVSAGVSFLLEESEDDEVNTERDKCDFSSHSFILTETLLQNKVVSFVAFQQKQVSYTFHTPLFIQFRNLRI